MATISALLVIQFFDEVIQYESIYGSSEEIQRVRHDLYARRGIETAGTVSQVLTDGSGLFAIVGAVAGHTAAAVENREQGGHKAAEGLGRPANGWYRMGCREFVIPLTRLAKNQQKDRLQSPRERSTQ